MIRLAYADSSVLVKHYVGNEKGSRLASKYIESSRIYTSSIARIEVLSALSRKYQSGEISLDVLSSFKNNFLKDCKRTGFVEVENEIVEESQGLFFRVSIKTLDAIHLASAIILKRVVNISYPFLTSDKQLANAAEKEGFEVIRIGL